MFKLIKIEKSKKKDKKFDATFFNKENNKQKIISFGSKGYRDYTLINNKNSEFYIPNKEQREKVKDLYQKRHAKDLLTEASKSGLSAGSLSYYVLWTGTTLNKGISNYRNKYNFPLQQPQLDDL